MTTKSRSQFTAKLKLNPADKAYVNQFITDCFSFNWDMSKCYAKVADDATYSFIKTERLGRLLLAPSDVGKPG